MPPVIGGEIKWTEVPQMVLRVKDFFRDDTEISSEGEVVAASNDRPYGYLLVEPPALNQALAVLPIIHRDDFLLADSVFSDPDVYAHVESGERELLVTYAPKEMNEQGYSLSPHHVLHYALTPKGTLEKYYSDSQIGYLRMAKPEPNLIFGPFKYEDEIRVNMNLAPGV